MLLVLESAVSSSLTPVDENVGIPLENRWKENKAAPAPTHNAGLYWPKHSFFKFPGKINLLIGDLINTSDLEITDIKKQIEVWMDQELIV